MISDIDIYRTANILVKRHGEDAPTPAGLPLIDPNQTYKTLEDMTYDLLLIGKL